ncbi:TetR/AcrR family transcriptional regulator [Nocardia sp. NPDC051832]|uniref:TetR/AcrR family transcriptional regulator n=1 Tax=Nocardia sp. NPDC051832 TaxID=3155673 RepID=UPI003442F68B
MSSVHSTENGQRRSANRQARGIRRRAEILATAESVFTEVGFEGATTNLIAQRAGVSPGSLYQFFRSKQDIAVSLAELYVAELTKAQSAAVGAPGARESDLNEFVDRSIDVMVRFNAAYPGFLALFMRADSPPPLREAIAPLQHMLSARIHEVLAAHMPDRSEAEIARYTLMVLQLARGVMPVIATEENPLESPLTGELKRALRAYLAEIG